MSESLAQAFVRYVHEDLAQVKQPHFDIAWRLAEAKRLGYAEELGYKNIYELAEVEFGLKKSSTIAYIAINDEFLTSRVGVVAERWQAYSFSLLVEMLPLDYYDRDCVKPNWTVKQIRQWRKDHKAVTLEDGSVKFWGELTDKQKTEYEQYKANKQRVDDVEEGVYQTSGKNASIPPIDLSGCADENIRFLAGLLHKYADDYGKLTMHTQSVFEYMATALYSMHKFSFEK